MRFTLTIDCDNAAFNENPHELGTLVHVVAQRIDAGHTGGAVMDHNGNRVGSWEFTDV